MVTTNTEATLSKSERTRSRLVDAGREIFIRDGFANTRISDIAAAAAVSHGTFYTYFASKQEIFQELVSGAVKRIGATMEDLWSIDLPPERALEAVMEAWITAYSAEAPILALIVGVGPQATELIAMREDVLAQQVNRSIEVVRRYQKAGLADRSLDPEYAATALALMVQSFAQRMSAGGDEFEFPKVVKTLARIWAGAIGLQPGKARSPA